MGFGGISMWQLLILLLIVVLVFGTKRLRNMGGDLGAAVKGFRKGMGDPKRSRRKAGAGPDQRRPKIGSSIGRAGQKQAIRKLDRVDV